MNVTKRIFIKYKIELWLMTIPCMAFVFIFHYLELFGWSISFVDFIPGANIFDLEFVGLKYFKLALRQPDLWMVLRNTAVFSLLLLVVSPLPPLFAILITELPAKKLVKVVQTTTTFPHFVSWVLIFSMCFALFSSEGAVNSVLLKLGLIKRPLNVLGNEGIVYSFQTALHIWKNIGYSAIVYMAAIASIDRELYDAAKVDGAGRFSRIRHIVIPGIMPTYLVLLVLSLGRFLNTGFEKYFMFYNPLVSNKIQVLDYYIYDIGLNMQNYSLATALGMYKTVISLILIMFANAVAKKIRGKSII